MFLLEDEKYSLIVGWYVKSEPFGARQFFYYIYIFYLIYENLAAY